MSKERVMGDFESVLVKTNAAWYLQCCTCTCCQHSYIIKNKHVVDLIVVITSASHTSFSLGLQKAARILHLPKPWKPIFTPKKPFSP